MHLTRDQFTALLDCIARRDDAGVRRTAIQIASRNGGEAVKFVDRALAPEKMSALVPDTMKSMIRQEDPWVGQRDLVVSQSIGSLIDRVVREQAHRDKLFNRGLSPLSRLLFHGPSGTGKTSVASAIAHELKWPFFIVPFDAIVGKYLGESSTRLRKVFDYIMTVQGVVLFDEIDAVGKSRGRGDDTGEQGRILTTLLVLLDEQRRSLTPSRNIIIGATNLHGHLDSALTRRFDEEVTFELSTPTDQLAIAARVFRRARVAGPELPWLSDSTLDGAPHHSDELRSAADVERWALAESKRLVIGQLLGKNEVDRNN